MTEASTKTEDTRGLRKSRVGVVVSDKMAKTVVVEITTQVQHPTYGKFIRRSKRFYAHDENRDAKLGDKVRIVETRPLSRLKRWRVEEILVRAE